MIYSIYHIPGIKIGCSDTPKARIRKQGYTEYTILETHDDIYVASAREFELQKQYGYKVDNTPYWKTIKMPTKESRSKGGKISGKINGKIASAKCKLLGLGIFNPENSGKGGKISGKIVQSIIHICQHCNTEMKGSNYFRWHGDNCKHA